MTIEAKLPNVYQLPNINQRPAVVAELPVNSTFNMPQFQEGVEDNEPTLPDWDDLSKSEKLGVVAVGTIAIVLTVNIVGVHVIRDRKYRETLRRHRKLERTHARERSADERKRLQEQMDLLRAKMQSETVVKKRRPVPGPSGLVTSDDDFLLVETERLKGEPFVPGDDEIIFTDAKGNEIWRQPVPELIKINRTLHGREREDRVHKIEVWAGSQVRKNENKRGARGWKYAVKKK